MITAATEAQKYRRMWARPEYGRRPAVLRRTPLAMEWAQQNECRTLYDYGCGMGWALDYFAGHGLECHGYDIAPPDPRPDITEACLWDLPDDGPAHFAFSADVLEHLPEERVGAVLHAMRARTTRAGFLRVFLRPDGKGHLIGETLHLTVRPVEWWLDAIGGAFDVAWHAVDGPAVNVWVLA